MKTLTRVMLSVVLSFLFGAQAFATCTFIVFPADGATDTSLTPTLKWNDTNASQYDVFLGTVGNGCTSNTPAGSTFGGDREFTTTQLLPGTTYEWKVRVADGICATPTPAESACTTFTTRNCPTNPASLTSPSNGSEVAFGNVNLSWSPVADADGYQLFLGLDGDTPSFHDGVAGTSKTIVVEPGRQVEWYVIPVATGGCDAGPASPSFTFTTDCPAVVPTLQQPSAGASVAAGEPILFKWTAVPGAAGYDLKINDGGGWVVIGENLETLQYTTALAEGDYEWEVRANFNGACDPAYSEVRELVVGPNCVGSGTPVLVLPANNVTTQVPVRFEWGAVDGAEHYTLLVQRTGDQLSRPLTTTNNTDYTTTDLDAGTYEWWIVASFPNCADTSSAKRVLTIQSNCPTGTTTLVSPANGALDVASPVTFHWTAVAGADRYRLFVSIDGGTPELLTTTTATSATEALQGNTVLWTVQAVFTDDCRTTSQPASFRLAQANNTCPTNPGKATLIAPANNATNLASPVTFTWNAVPSAIGYRVLAGFGANAEPISLGITAGTSLTADVPAGSGFWMVQTFFGEDCPATLSERRALTVTQGAACNDTPPQLLAPADHAVNMPSLITFAWHPQTKVTKYRLFVATGDDDDFVFYGETTGTSLQRLVPEGLVKWYVVAGYAGCPELRSQTWEFTVGGNACPAVAITLLAPANGSVNTSPVRLAWTPAGNNVEYRIWIALDGGAPFVVARTASTDVTLDLPAGQLRWYVEARRQACDPILSNEGTFRVSEGAACANIPAPVLVSPIGPLSNPANVNSPVMLTWNAVPNAIGYRVWLGNGTSFGDVAVTQATSYQINLGPDIYGWFVQALVAGCPPKASERAYFRVHVNEPVCQTAVPVILAPGAGETVDAPVTFTWTPVPGAQKYRVHVSVDGSDPVTIGATKETTLTRVVPPGVAGWAVEAVFEECPSTFSQRSQFTIRQAVNCTTEGAPLLSPPNAANLTDSPVEFVWSPVSGAVKYVVMARVNDGAATALAATDETSITHAMPPGRVEWWVLTFFAGCDPTQSQHFTFTMARRQDCETRKPILLLPSDEGNAGSPVFFQWTAVPRATGYKVWARLIDESNENSDASIIAATSVPKAEVELPVGTYEWFVEADVPNCPAVESARAEFTVELSAACGTPDKPTVQVVGQTLSNTNYRVRWTSLPHVRLYEIQESTTADFADAVTFTTNEPSRQFSHQVDGAPVQYLYRVRGIADCGEERGLYSDPIGVFVTPPKTNNASTEVGSEGNVVQKLFLPGSATPLQFVATADKPWLTITPSAGTVPPEGLTLTVTADPSVLALGTNTGTIQIAYTSSAKGGPGTNATTTTLIPLSVSLVTPVLPSGKGTPPPDSLIFPVVGHAQGANDSLFESDIRVTNLSATTMKYALNFTPSGVDGTTTGSSSTIEIAPNATLAVDDIVASLFGTGTVSSATGMLEVRPLTTSSSPATGLLGTGTSSTIKQLITAASSRTYNFTPTGTFGQFIPATRFADFVGRVAAGGVPSILSLQQVAQSADYRANFGFAEASGKPADLVVRVYDIHSALLATLPVSLKAGEHKQINGMLSANGITNLTDGRVEVEVVGGDGKVTAYVSEVDNLTNDPLLVSAVPKGAIQSNRYVVPGAAYIDTGFAFWVTDLRVFNSGTAATPATVTFYPQGNPAAAVSREITLDAGEIEVLDNVVASLFGQANGSGGQIAITTPATTSLTATARTYNKTANGTYGQYIPGVTPAQSAGLGDRSLQLLQLEQSSRIRTNIGLSETSGNPVRIEVSAIVPDTIFTPFVTIDLQANEFRQISLGDFGLGTAYNARVAIKVVSGTGRVTAYGSAIDMITQDPTYVPAQ